MTDDQIDNWTDRCKASFDEWVAKHFTQIARSTWVAKEKRSEKAWVALLTKFNMLDQFNANQTFELYTEGGERDIEADCFYVYKVYKKLGNTYEPTEGMMININTGEMSYC